MAVTALDASEAITCVPRVKRGPREESTALGRTLNAHSSLFGLVTRFFAPAGEAPWPASLPILTLVPFATPAPSLLILTLVPFATPAPARDLSSSCSPCPRRLAPPTPPLHPLTFSWLSPFTSCDDLVSFGVHCPLPRAPVHPPSPPCTSQAVSCLGLRSPTPPSASTAYQYLFPEQKNSQLFFLK